MAWDFLGTFNKSQFTRLQTFAQNQIPDITGRLSHLAAEQVRVGSVVFQFDQAVVVSYTVSDPNSYIGRLFKVYEILGGDAFFDLPVRSVTQALFLLPGNESHSAQLLSNGKVVGTQGLFDAASAIPIQQMKEWMNDSIQYKREAIERKIRRAIDYSDQLTAEITLLQTVMQTDASISGSLPNLIAAINSLLTSQNYRAIADDQGKDPMGNYAYAPYIGLEPGPSRTQVDGYYRSLQGYLTPNDGLNTP